jgi:hypothetical protein
MTANRDFDAVARAWLDLMPDEAPDRVIESVLLAVDAEPQVRVPRIGGWRLIPMNRLALASAAAVIVAAGLFFVAPRPSGPSAGPTPSPTATNSPAASPIGSPTRSSAPAAAAEAADHLARRPGPAPRAHRAIGAGIQPCVHREWQRQRRVGASE